MFGFVPKLKAIVSKLPHKFLFLWLVVIIAVYTIFLRNPAPLVYDIAIPTNEMVNAIVFIAMGSLASDAMVDQSIASVRKNGKWEGEIFIITDRPPCFTSTSQYLNVKTITVPSARNIIEIKSLKAKIFDYMPPSIHGILYLDADIIVKQSLEYFFRDLSDLVVRKSISLSPMKLSLQDAPLHLRKINVSNPLLQESYRAPPSTFDFAAFPDALGHFVGFCSGCEKWHTGIMYFRRSSQNSCLEAWHKILLSGKYGTDQQSLDEAERLGYCPHAYFLPKKHLLFAKDYLGMIFTSRHTFIHLTAAARPSEQDSFYRYFVMPQLRKSEAKLEGSYIHDGKKDCPVESKSRE